MVRDLDPRRPSPEQPKTSIDELITTAREQGELDEYETFDDYMEMVMQFGYVTLFASAFPLAGFLSLVGNLIEIRSDLFKLAFVARRPIPVRTTNIGPWASVLKCFAYMAVVTNALMFGFTSNQMRWFFPCYFDENGVVADEQGRLVVATVFIFEHLWFLAVLLVDFAINEKPYSVQQILKRRRVQMAKKAA